MTRSQLIRLAWRSGRLDYKLDPHQLAVYRKYRKWEEAVDLAEVDFDEDASTFLLCFVMDIARRWGKTWLLIVIMFENCLRRGKSIHLLATVTATDLAEIVIPIADEIMQDAPKEYRPVLRTSSEGQRMHYRFPNGSQLRLVGIDENPRKLRGRGLDGFAITEAGHVKGLTDTLMSIVLPQFQRRPWARAILESNAPKDIDHDFDRDVVPSAKARSCESCAGQGSVHACEQPETGCAYQFATIEDNEVLSEREIARFNVMAGGRNHPVCRRENYGERVQDAEIQIVPEWDKTQHVQVLEVPDYAVCIVAMDPGSTDHMAILWAYIDFEHQRVVVQRSYSKPNASTTDVAVVLEERKSELWSGLTYWDPGREEFRPNPLMLASDVNPRLRQDLANDHKIYVAPVVKTGEHGGIQAELKDAGVASFRTAVSRGQILADPAATEFIDHMTAGRWKDEKRSDYERTKRYGHFDCIDAGVVLWRTAKTYLNKNPFPPGHVGKQLPPNSYSKHAIPERPESLVAAAMNDLWGRRPAGKPAKATWSRDKGRTWRRGG